jgi:HSP20 family molecular chaperone IbpA
MNTKIITGLLTFVVAVLIIVATEQHHSITGMQKQLAEIKAQPVASETITVATTDADTDVMPTADASTVMPATTPPPATPTVAPTVTPATPPATATAQKPPTPIDPQASNKQAPSNAIDNLNDPFSTGQLDPYSEIQRMQEEMDRMMNQAFNQYGYDPYYDPYYGRPGGPNFGPGQGPRMRHGPPPGFRHSMRDNLAPDMDLQDKGDHYLVLVDVPGTDANSISVKLEGDRLTISAKQSYDKEDKDSHGNVIFRERRSGSFRRSTSLPGPVKKSGMKTDYDKGVLRITIPKA